ncbi:hypothetical protein ACFXHD_00340 [Streptomyces hydrogenans]|uniref:hypothetical protein n=1 Tax=Streptomyces hydrogenans TaxID=1873719 RepID=UPI00368A74E4
MPEYSVTWTLDVEAGTPRLAALAALAIQRDPASWATVFTVHTDNGDVVLDLHPDQTGPRGSRPPTA